MSKRWVIRETNTDLVRSVSSAAHIPELLASLLVSRGIRTPDAAKAFLKANLKEHFRPPERLPGCTEVAERLFHAVRDGKKIVVYGDYDVDGITGIAILYKALKGIGASVSYYVPSRFDEGYGLNSEAIRKLSADDGIDVMVTVDCGIASIEEALIAKECGMELLITDHHMPDSELPRAEAIAHPQLVRFQDRVVSPRSLSPEQRDLAEPYPFTDLCGAAVALKVAWALGQLAAGGFGKPVSAEFREQLKEMLGLAAMGTVADFVALQDENRALVRTGLDYLVPSIISPGLRELLRVSKYVEGRTRIDAEFIAFQLAPRLNAAGRLGLAALAVELLLSSDRGRVCELAEEIDKLNESRKTLEKRIVKEAERQIRELYDPSDPAFVLASAEWHKGVIGIVASRLVERHHRPVILLGKDPMGNGPAVGSARSIPGFNIYDALKSCDELLVRFGGHSAAAGLTIEEKNIDAFRDALCDVADRGISEEERVGELFIDGEFPLGAFTRQAVDQISLLAPFGCKNARPIFAASGVRLVNPKPMGKDESHFSAEFQQGPVKLRGIAFSRSDWLEKMRPHEDPMDIAFKVKLSDFNGKIELDILDWRR